MEVSVSRIARIATTAGLLALLPTPSGAVDHERWAIKTSIQSSADVSHPHTVVLSKLMTLPGPTGITRADVTTYADKLIPGTTAGLKEGEIISTKGYIHVVMYSTEDDDYHVQVSLKKSKTDKSCFIVEVPKDASGFAEAGAVRDSARVVRRWLQGLTHDHEPSTGGSLMGGPPYVKVVGQLFFDASHTSGPKRGRRGQKARSAWEIHPIMHIEFAPIPH
jgi:hypothetical protein